MFDKLKYISFFVLLSVGVFASASEIIDQEFTTRACSVLLEDRTGSGGEYANLDTEFTRIITIGCDCSSKSQINHYFNNNLDFPTKSGHADIFDWMVINNYDLFSEALSNNLTDVFEKKDFSIGQKFWSPYPLNSKYDMHWAHLLDHYFWSSYPNESKFNTNFVFDLFNENFESEKIKIDYLKEKFIQSKENNTIYVVNDKYNLLKIESIINLRNSLTKIRCEKNNFVILVVSLEKNYEDFENIIIREGKRFCKPDTTWDLGDYERWKEILDEFKFSSDIWD